MGAVLGVAIQHVISIRESLLVFLPGAIADSGVLDAFRMIEEFRSRSQLYTQAALKWLERENLTVHQPELFVEDGSAGGLLAASIESMFRDLAGASLQDFEHQFQVSREDQDYGAKRSGTGWQNPINFILTSAFLRLAGAIEEFQKDVLKALFYYRPPGLLGQHADQIAQIARFDDIFEPDLVEENGEKAYQKPVAWNRLSRKVQTKLSRENLFQKAFGIKLKPEGIDEKTEWSKIRNATAHGFMSETLTLTQFVEFEVFVVLSIKHLADQCKAKFKLEL